MKRSKIINPVTGRLVKRTGRIGIRLIKAGEVHTNLKRYKKVLILWDWWAGQTDEVRQQVVDSGLWDTRLNDMEKGKYPFYIMSYEKVLKRVKRYLGN